MEPEKVRQEFERLATERNLITTRYSGKTFKLAYENGITDASYRWFEAGAAYAQSAAPPVERPTATPQRVYDALGKAKVRYSRDRGMPNPSEPLPTHVEFSLADWKVVTDWLAGSEREAQPLPSRALLCPHDRLDEEGYCRTCGSDMRSGIDLTPALPAVPQATDVSERQKKYEDGCRAIANDLRGQIAGLPLPTRLLAIGNLMDLFNAIRPAYSNGRTDQAESGSQPAQPATPQAGSECPTCHSQIKKYRLCLECRTMHLFPERHNPNPCTDPWHDAGVKEKP